MRAWEILRNRAAIALDLFLFPVGSVSDCLAAICSVHRYTWLAQEQVLNIKKQLFNAKKQFSLPELCKVIFVLTFEACGISIDEWTVAGSSEATKGIQYIYDQYTARLAIVQ